MVGQRAELTFKYNQEQGRHGWIRLTPAYSVKTVGRFLAGAGSSDGVLDPFSGTGTTGLVCAERGIGCDLVEINPFLVWLAKVKTRNYSAHELELAGKLIQTIVDIDYAGSDNKVWVPPIQFIERWWTPRRLTTLAQIFARIQSVRKMAPQPSVDLILVAFCRLVIDWSNAAFNHQSVSFKGSIQPSLFEHDEGSLMIDSFQRIASRIIQDAKAPVAKEPAVIEGDSRHIEALVSGPYTRVITSPPYPNRMSYIRELRPYMYWLGYLTDAEQAGELDWKAIGGTWGVATSRVADWKSPGPPIEHDGFDLMIEAIATGEGKNGALLANYVHKYFADMVTHFMSLRKVLEPGAQVIYIVGNSKFYNTLVPVERILASIMRQCDFSNPRIEPLRKRNSKKELYEYAVIASVS